MSDGGGSGFQIDPSALVIGGRAIGISSPDREAVENSCVGNSSGGSVSE